MNVIGRLLSTNHNIITYITKMLQPVLVKHGRVEYKLGLSDCVYFHIMIIFSKTDQ